jgi:hypothetical protein
MDVHSLRVQQRFARDVARTESACAKVRNLRMILQ